MTTEEKELLLKDLCARLPYGVEVQYKGNRYDLTEMHKDGRTYLGSYNSIYGDWHCNLEFEDYPKPYLRPMSSMTEEERKNFIKCAGYEVEESENGRHYDYYLKDFCGTEDAPCANADAIDWLNEHHFDYRGLINKGLALEAPKDIYKEK